MAIDGPPAGLALGFHVSPATIPSHDGTLLKAVVVTPEGDGPFPVLVMPSSWAVDRLEYLGAAVKLAHDSDYIVVSYTCRGFWDSGGEIDVAGPDTVADVSSVIDWALRHTPADPARIGAVGISYGAGLSLLAAARDDRIRAVAAMSAWTDMSLSMYPNETLSSQTAVILLLSGDVTGRPGPVLQQMQHDFLTGRIGDILSQLPARSPAGVVDAINHNAPAVLLANAWEDSLFPPGQIADFFARLTCPKRLMFAPGDHATAELPGLIGLPNDPWALVRQWMDHFLRNLASLDANGAVSMKPANGGSWRGYPDWSAASPTWTRRYLGPPAAPLPLLPKSGSLGKTATSPWEYSIRAGIPTIADSGAALVTGVLQGYFNASVPVPIPLIARVAAGVWRTERRSASALVSGAPRVHLTVTPSAPDTTLFFYLYDVDELDLGSLITRQPYSLLGATPGAARTVDVRLEPVAWHIHGGHHLALVIDTMDLRYQSSSSVASTVTFSSLDSDGSYLDLPTAT